MPLGLMKKRLVCSRPSKIAGPVKRVDAANANVVSANTETARKNGEEQWWSVLQWAYEQASKGGAAANLFKDKAVLGILASLAVEGLTAVQQRSLEQITKVFEAKQDPATTQQVATLRAAVNASARTVIQQSRYALNVLRVLIKLKPPLKRLYAFENDTPVIYKTKKGSLVAVQPLWLDLTDDAGLPVNVRTAVRAEEARIMARTFTVTDERPKNSHDGTADPAALQQDQRVNVNKVLIVANANGYWPSDTGTDPRWVRYTPADRLEPFSDPVDETSTRSLQKALEELAEA